MSDKSEALKLADVVDVFDAQSERLPLELYSDISSELRRLHEVNKELLEALKLALEYWRHRQQRYKNRSPVWVQAARAAIKKATGESA